MSSFDIVFADQVFETGPENTCVLLEFFGLFYFEH